MEPDDWVELVPPPGGLGRLRRRLDAQQPDGMRWPRWVAGGVMAAVVAVILVALGTAGPAKNAPVDLALDPVWMHLEGVERGVRVQAEAVGRVALVQVPVSTPGVHMVRVAATRVAQGFPAGPEGSR